MTTKATDHARLLSSLAPLFFFPVALMAVGCVGNKAVAVAAIEAGGALKTPVLSDCRVVRKSPSSTTLNCGHGWDFEVFSSAYMAPQPEDMVEMARSGGKDIDFKLKEEVRSGQKWRTGIIKAVSPDEAVIETAVIFAHVSSFTTEKAVTCSGIRVGDSSVSSFCGPIVDALLSKTLSELDISTARPTIFGTEIELHPTARVVSMDERSWGANDEKSNRLYVAHFRSNPGQDAVASWLESARSDALQDGQTPQPITEQACRVAGRASTCNRLISVASNGDRNVVVVALFPNAGTGQSSGHDFFYHCSWMGEPSVPGNICSRTLEF